MKYSFNKYYPIAQKIFYGYRFPESFYVAEYAFCIGVAATFILPFLSYNDITLAVSKLQFESLNFP